MKSMKPEHPTRKFFVRFGDICNTFEHKINRMLVASPGLGIVPKLANSLAFEKGIEWFTEIFFFYGTLALLAYYEISRNEAKRIKQIEDIDLLNSETSKFRSAIDVIASEIEEIERHSSVIS